jgi:acylphosphatase
MPTLAHLYAMVHGRVQGVYYRAWTVEQSSVLGLTGIVRNLSSGEDVEIEAEGERDRLEQLVKLLKTGPPGAKVESVEVTWSQYSAVFTGFQVRYQDS